MFEMKEGIDKLFRKYIYVSGDNRKLEPTPVYLLLPTYNEEDYLEYCLKSFENQVNGFFAVDNYSTDRTTNILKDYNVKFVKSKVKNDMGKLLNIGLKQIPKNSWVFRVDGDQVLFDLPNNYFGRYATFLQKNKIFCSDVRNVEMCYNYGTILALDWGDGPGILWTARRLFYYTGKEKFIGKWHENVTNVSNGHVVYNNEHTGEWNGVVVKTHEILLFHYGKCKDIEKWRKKAKRAVINIELGAWGFLPTMPYYGKHPSVMGL